MFSYLLFNIDDMLAGLSNFVHLKTGEGPKQDWFVYDTKHDKKKRLIELHNVPHWLPNHNFLQIWSICCQNVLISAVLC